MAPARRRDGVLTPAPNEFGFPEGTAEIRFQSRCHTREFNPVVAGS